MAFQRSGRTGGDARQNAEAAFRAVTNKKPDDVTPKPAPVAAVPGSRETISLRIDRAVLEHFQKDGPGWQDRINAALKTAAGV